jgi:proteasome lid subunit RPN8/RPN11
VALNGQENRLLSVPSDIVFPTMPAALRRVQDLGIETAPEEACGILVDEAGGIRVVQMLNRADDRLNGYAIDPVTLRQLALKPGSWKHVAIWHTHPGGMVGPSLGDLDHRIHGVEYVVVTIPSGETRWF